MLYFAASVFFSTFAADYKAFTDMIIGRKEEIAELDWLYHSDRIKC